MEKFRFELIRSFPDFRENGFSMETYNDQFLKANVVIHDEARSIFYPEHWGPLSLKCAFNGEEIYSVNNGDFSVNDSRYLILNQGNYYSSYIESSTKVESFSINFFPPLVAEVTAYMTESDDWHLSNYEYYRNEIVFNEQLYSYSPSIRSLIMSFQQIVRDNKTNAESLEALYRPLLENLIAKQRLLMNDIRRVPKIRLVTKKELYKRLTRAKDYMDSCYNRDISVEFVAALVYLNHSYFLREFKKFYQISPRQYIIKKRMEIAKSYLVRQKHLPVSEICSIVGYHDLSSFSKLFKRYFGLSPEHYSISLQN